MKYIKWLWTDDKTGKFSNTTFRTWLTFLLLFACFIFWVFIDSDGISPREEILVEVMVWFCLGQGGLYGFKRFSERKMPRSFLQEDSQPQTGQSPDEIEDNLRERGL